MGAASAADKVVKPGMDGAAGSPAEERVLSAICDPLPTPLREGANFIAP